MPVAPHPPALTIENNIIYPFRLRHSYGQTADFPTPTSTRPQHTLPDRADSAVLSPGSLHGSRPPSALDTDVAISALPPAHLAGGRSPPPRLSHASAHTDSLATLRSRGSPASTSSPTSADFPIVPARPPLRPTVSFGGVSGMSYYSSLSAETELEARSISLALAEEGKGSVGSWREGSLRKVRSLGCVWPEARRKGRRKD